MPRTSSPDFELSAPFSELYYSQMLALPKKKPKALLLRQDMFIVSFSAQKVQFVPSCSLIFLRKVHNVQQN